MIAAPAVKSGIDVDGIDKTCKPCEDFYRYANGTWLDKNPIPASRSSWGTFSIMAEGNRERLRVILESAADGKAAAGTNERKVGDLYGACMDTAKREALGVKPIQADLDAIAKVATREQLRELLITFLRTDTPAPVGIFAAPDLKDAKETIGGVLVQGTSIRDREFYFRQDERSTRIREAFAAHVERMLKLGGIDSPGAGKTILAFETEAARPMLSLVERRDPYKRYNKMDLAGVNELSPGFDWAPVLKALGLPAQTPLNVSEPNVVRHFAKQLSSAPLETWKLWLQWRLLKESATLLTDAMEAEDFDFDQRTVNGVKEQLPRWMRCTATVDTTLGDALGEVFVKKHFPPAAKQRMNELVENVRATLREELRSASWMTPETRKNALVKLNSFYTKIGYPERWRDYSQVTVRRENLLESTRSAGRVQRAYRLAKIGKPLDRNDWGMTPPTVNAYYSSTMNEIAFPAGILQSPFFDMEADDAANYGAIGAVIGHEMGHGFDDQGSKFDFAGNLKNWWTEEDRTKFESRAQCVVDQFNSLDVGDNLRHNGRLVVGEALGDLGGVTIAYKAYQRSLRGKPAPPVMDGFTADQRFFLAFARLWGRHNRPDFIRTILQTDPHPISKFRANGTLMNVPEFHKAFGCKLGDAMVRPPDRQCKLW
jgi:putative endopeptidase